MYKPPENTNRVKAIKSKFENNENINTQQFTDRKPPTTLSRQLSDPIKVNIKRSPAFRNDKLLQRNGAQISVKLNKNKSLTNNKNCDNPKPPVTTKALDKPSFNSLRKRFDSQENLTKIAPKHLLKERSNTSEEIVFNRKPAAKPKEELKYENLSILYTEPIPKSQRVKEPNIHNTSTLKISEKKQIEDEYIHKLNILTDTLKLALKKPLPAGPAPKKPPRTFQHSPQSHKSKEDFAQQLSDNLQKSLDNQKKSPKYMLDKLENALKNNKIRLKRQAKVDYTSESDESFDSKSVTKFNLNCLQSLGCSNATYEAINQPNSQFFDGCEEPVYAEPFVFPLKENDEKEKNGKKFNRNSLYYMSTPVTTTDGIFSLDNMDDQIVINSDVGDTSSLSTPGTSDIDSLTSTPSEENKPLFTSSKIRDLIRNFESRKMESVDCRVDNLERQMKKALDVSFDSKEETVSERGSVDGESSDKIAGKFATYVKTIRLCTKARVKNDGKVLFQCCMLVGLNGKEPYVKFQFPKSAELPYKIEELCFPDSRDSTIDCSLKAQNYSIVITNNEGERIYGYCRRVLPEDSTTCLPLAYCILSKHRAPRFYRRILQELESRHGIPDKIRDIFLNEIYYTKFPTPGESVRFNMIEVNKHIMESTLEDKPAESNGLERISNDSDLTEYEIIGCGEGYGSITNGANYNKRNGVLFKNGIIPKEIWDDYKENSNSNPSSLVIPLDQDARHKETDLEELCNTLNINILIKVFASLLLERKVIFISCVLGKLSTCIEAIQNMLYPFSWPHTLIPVVPKELWEIVEAPTPLICGTLSLAVVNDYNIEDGIVVDLDERAILLEVGDENKILPSCLQKELKDGMQLAKGSENEGALNVLLSDAFLRIFILLCGHYKDSIKDGNFQKEEFINYHKSKSKRRFLKWFTETTMFYTFIDSVLADKNVFKIFDKRIQIYSSQDAKLILEKMKDWKKDRSNTLGIF